MGIKRTYKRIVIRRTGKRIVIKKKSDKKNDDKNRPGLKVTKNESENKKNMRKYFLFSLE